MPESGPRGRPRIYCSAACYPSKLKRERPKLLCIRCGEEFPAGRRGPLGSYCSPNCKSIAYRVYAPQPGPINCAWCGRDFIPRRNGDIRHCSPECRGADYRASHQERLREEKPPYEMECHFCGDVFTVDPMKRKNRPKYCRPTCAQQAARDARRARLALLDYERVDRHTAFERDGYICGICNEPVDRALKYPDPRSASLDHVIPIAQGGSHTYDNVQCSHLECNVRAGAKQNAISHA